MVSAGVRPGQARPVPDKRPGPRHLAAHRLAAHRLAARRLAARDPAMALVALTVATVTITRSATRLKTTAGRTTSALLCGVKRCRARDGEAPRERHFGVWHSQ